jgi:hypothetical protein
MATVRKVGGTTVRRRTKSADKQATGTERASNGLRAHNGGADTGSNPEFNIETIRVRAYQLFCERGATHGRDLADWLQAERELRAARKL